MTSTQEQFSKAVQVSLELPHNEALALAQFVKRVGFSELEANASDENEAYEIKDAIGKLQHALVEAGYNPR